MTKVIHHRKDNVMLPCPYAKKCGGCSLQNLPYEEQLHLKQAKLIKLERFGMICGSS